MRTDIMVERGERTHRSPARFLALLVLLAAGLSLLQLDRVIPIPEWTSALGHPDPDDIRLLVVSQSMLPRIATCLLCGALLSLSGVIFQQILRNPLAEPTTLGVSAGASLAMTLVIALEPQWLIVGQTVVAAAGAGIALLLALGLAWRQRLSPVALILAGLVISFYSGAISAVLTMFHHDALQAISFWGAGSMNQGNWKAARLLLPYLFVGMALAQLLARPFELMSLGDGAARGLGLPPGAIRILGLGLGVLLSAAVVSAVGVIGFVGLVAPALVRLMGARTYRARVMWAPALGSVLVWLTDQTVQSLGAPLSRLPTGAVIALLASPLLLWLLPRLQNAAMTPEKVQADHVPGNTSLVPLELAFGGVLLMVVAGVSLLFGRDLSGWHWLSTSELDVLLDYRLSRLLAALAAGAMLAMAGVIVQRLTGNAMASPEVLGISSGASLGLFAIVLLMPGAGMAAQSVAACIGALLSFLAILALGKRNGFSPPYMLLAGVAIGAAFSALATIVMLSGTPDAVQLLAWMSGSTYGLGPVNAAFAVGSLLLAVAVTPMLGHWLQIIPLGSSVAVGLGVDLRLSRLTLLIVASFLTGSATLVVGPLSFVGLMAPHVARMLGLGQVRFQIPASALIGAIIMGIADWLGRNIAFPFQVPAGMLATLLGGLYFMWLMARGRSAS
ncbi:Fe(3+)-hydroxamate ABC transporter permease FhuB [Paraburkholderia tropica]|uniref:Fe(3+)-hydroxamate ABC transporter permease FhuB n=1 Tax=Paraburkholderia tropica TaxID=92647 RepID=UPI0009F6135E|nr:Fe(3+)-hydroxamate ABC transporter permease FhuB [Paraburkholderia tropica]